MPVQHVEYKVGSDPRELVRHGIIRSSKTVGGSKEHNIVEATRGYSDHIQDSNIVKRISEEEYKAYLRKLLLADIERSNSVARRELTSPNRGEPMALFNVLLPIDGSNPDERAWYMITGVGKTGYHLHWRGYEESRWVPTVMGKSLCVPHKFVLDRLSYIDLDDMSSSSRRSVPSAEELLC